MATVEIVPANTDRRDDMACLALTTVDTVSGLAFLSIGPQV